MRGGGWLERSRIDLGLTWDSCGNPPLSFGVTQKPLPEEPLPLNLAARCLRVPKGWLLLEIQAMRIPALIAGRSVLVHVPTVAAILAERAKVGT